MQITNDLNLAFPIRAHLEYVPDPDHEGQIKRLVVPDLWAYHVPINEESFNASWRVISNAKAELFSKGLVVAANNGPRVATRALLDAGRLDALQFGGEDTSKALLAEIKRLTHVLSPGKTGFDMLPIDVALAQTVIDRDEWSEAESSIVFFTCGYTMALRLDRDNLANAIAGILRGSMTSLMPMEFAASLKTSTPDGTSATAAPSLPPS